MTSLVLALLLTGCGTGPAPAGGVVPEQQDAATAPVPADDGPAPRRVLVVVADDLGVDSLSAYADEAADSAAERSYAPTPTIDGLCSDGVRFTEAWANPTCSPSRAAMLTGRFGARTGIGHAVPRGEPGLAAGEPTVPRWLASHRPAPVATALVGKWHLGATDDVGGAAAPNAFGFDHFAGTLENSVADWFRWIRTEDGVTDWSETYATTAHIDDAIAWVDQRSEDEDWMLWVSLTAPHEPLHAPPVHLHSYGPLSPAMEDVAGDPVTYFQASLEAADTELGRLLDHLEAQGMGEVDVVFIGDNGTSERVIEAPWDARQAKETLYEGGVHVPLCVAGPSVAQPGRSSTALVHIVDLFATSGELLGLDPVADLPDTHTFDSVSFAPVLADPASTGARTWSYTEGFGGCRADGAGAAARDERYKLVRWEDGDVAAFDLQADPRERRDLLLAGPLDDEVAARLDALEAVLDGIAADTGR